MLFFFFSFFFFFSLLSSSAFSFSTSLVSDPWTQQSPLPTPPHHHHHAGHSRADTVTREKWRLWCMQTDLLPSACLISLHLLFFFPLTSPNFTPVLFSIDPPTTLPTLLLLVSLFLHFFSVHSHFPSGGGRPTDCKEGQLVLCSDWVPEISNTRGCERAGIYEEQKAAVTESETAG